MGKYSALTDGRAITAAVKSDILRSATVIDLHREWTQFPTDHRNEVRKAETFNARQALDEGRRAIQAWADETRASATKRLNTRDTGSAAEESRRVAAELRIGRLVAAGQANPRGSAEDLQDRASMAYARGDADEAGILAQAAMELAPQTTSLAKEIIGNIEADEILADPDRAKALRQLNDVDVVLTAFERDGLAALANALQHWQRLARDLGDSEGISADAYQEATKASVRAKLEAYAASQATGTAYEEPAGTVPGLPQDIDPRGVSQPIGAHIGGGTEPA